MVYCALKATRAVNRRISWLALRPHGRRCSPHSRHSTGHLRERLRLDALVQARAVVNQRDDVSGWLAGTQQIVAAVDNDRIPFDDADDDSRSPACDDLEPSGRQPRLKPIRDDPRRIGRTRQPPSSASAASQATAEPCDTYCHHLDLGGYSSTMRVETGRRASPAPPHRDLNQPAIDDPGNAGRSEPRTWCWAGGPASGEWLTANDAGSQIATVRPAERRR